MHTDVSLDGIGEVAPKGWTFSLVGDQLGLQREGKPYQIVPRAEIGGRADPGGLPLPTDEGVGGEDLAGESGQPLPLERPEPLPGERLQPLVEVRNVSHAGAV